MTPIEHARNLGPRSAEELTTVGIGTLESLRALGWEEALLRWAHAFPGRVNRNAAYALIGAVDNTDWRALSASQRAAAHELVAELRGRPS